MIERVGIDVYPAWEWRPRAYRGSGHRFVRWLCFSLWAKWPYDLPLPPPDPNSIHADAMLRERKT